VLQQLTQLGRTDSAVGAPIDFTKVQKYDFFAQCSVYVFYVYGLYNENSVSHKKRIIFNWLCIKNSRWNKFVCLSASID